MYNDWSMVRKESDYLNLFEESHRHLVLQMREFKSKMLFTEQYKLLGVFETNMSRISGFFLRDVGQYVGSGGASIWNFLILVTL